jgi:predicted transcriptional regulator
MKLAIQLSEAQERRLTEIAARLNIPAESLAEAAVRELVDQSEGEFDDVAKRLLEKNRELYERLR